jgi:dihydrolipoamide dehydrogenase
LAEHNFDLVVLGGGSGGYAAALRAAELGMTVGLIEKGKLGGTCLHVGCIPTKALLHSAEVADVTRESAKYGVTATLEGIDIAGVTKYRQDIVASKYKGLQGLLKMRGVAVIEGEGKLVAPNTVQVGEETVVGKNIVLATGSY